MAKEVGAEALGRFFVPMEKYEADVSGVDLRILFMITHAGSIL